MYLCTGPYCYVVSMYIKQDTLKAIEIHDFLLEVLSESYFHKFVSNNMDWGSSSKIQRLNNSAVVSR